MVESEESSSTGTKSVTDNNSSVTNSALITLNPTLTEDFNVKVNKAYIMKEVRKTLENVIISEAVKST